MQFHSANDIEHHEFLATCYFEGSGFNGCFVNLWISSAKKARPESHESNRDMLVRSQKFFATKRGKLIFRNIHSINI
jgi:hypothetical protein